jgi:hypothetical protein
MSVTYSEFRFRSAYAILGLVDLVTDGILGGSGTGAEVDVAVLGDVLVGLLGTLVGELGSLVTYVVGGVP